MAARCRLRLLLGSSPMFPPVSGCKAQTTTISSAFSIRSLQPTLTPSGPHVSDMIALTGDTRCPYVPKVCLRSPPTLPALRVHGFTVIALRAVRDVPILRDRRISLRFAPFASKPGENIGLESRPSKEGFLRPSLSNHQPAAHAAGLVPLREPTGLERFISCVCPGGRSPRPEGAFVHRKYISEE